MKKSIKTMDFFLFPWYNKITFKFGKNNTNARLKACNKREKEELAKGAKKKRWFLKIITKY